MATKKSTTTNDQDERPEAERPEAERDAIVLVKMTRDVEFYPAPHTADVHPDEVDNYASAGWVTQE